MVGSPRRMFVSLRRRVARPVFCGHLFPRLAIPLPQRRQLDASPDNAQRHVPLGRFHHLRRALRHQLQDISLAATLLLAWRVDVNEFSSHLPYRNRLVRCFLGASVPTPRPFQPFTGFSSKDDLSLADISPTVTTASSATDGRPFPILNTTLNVVR